MSSVVWPLTLLPPICFSGGRDERLNEMREFFHGWRRKVGCVALVMAVLACGEWGRRRIDPDAVMLAFGRCQHEITCYDDQFFWSSWYAREEHQQIGWTSSPRVIIEYRDMDSEVKQASLPCWPFRLTLTLLAAYLILWKPRPKE